MIFFRIIHFFGSEESIWFCDHKSIFGFSLACEQALLFGRVKRVLRERASELRSHKGQRKGRSPEARFTLPNPKKRTDNCQRICRHFGIWCMGYCCGGWISRSSRAERIVIYAVFTLKNLREVQESSILTFSVHGNHWSFLQAPSEIRVYGPRVQM